MLGIRLKEERKRLKFKQKELASIISVSPVSVISYEKGQTVPLVTFLEKLAPLGFDVQYIITGISSESTPLPDEEKEMLELFRSADDKIKLACKSVLMSGITPTNTVNINNNENVNF